MLGGFALAIALAGACKPNVRPRDLAGDRATRRLEATTAATDAGSGPDGVPEAPAPSAQAATIGKKARVFTRATTRALALDALNVYYGDSEDDGIYTMPKAGGTAVRIARHAPVAGAIALESDAVTWIGSPGDAVLKASLRGGQPTTLRDKGIFSDVAAAGGDVFITEAIGAGGALLRVSNGVTSKLTSFDGAPRAVMADATHTYVVTPTKILRTLHAKGELETIATGVGFTYTEIDEGFVYVIGQSAGLTVVARVAKNGGPLTPVALNVRSAPLRVVGGELLFFDALRPRLLSAPAAGGEPHIVYEDEALTAASALDADATTIYVATGANESGVISAIDRR